MVIPRPARFAQIDDAAVADTTASARNRHLAANPFANEQCSHGTWLNAFCYPCLVESCDTATERECRLGWRMAECHKMP